MISLAKEDILPQEGLIMDNAQNAKKKGMLNFILKTEMLKLNELKRIQKLTKKENVNIIKNTDCII